MDGDIELKMHVDGRRSPFTRPGTSLVDIRLNQSGVTRTRTWHAVVSVTKHPIAPQLDVLIPVPSHLLLLPEDDDGSAHFLNRVTHAFAAVAGPYVPRHYVVSRVFSALRELASRLHGGEDDDDDDDACMGYYFYADIEILVLERLVIYRDPNDIGEDVEVNISININNSFSNVANGASNVAISSSAIERLEARSFVGGNNNSSNNGVVAELGSCGICLENMCGGVKRLVDLPCKHVFHVRCILMWLSRNNSCPLCRNPVL